MYYIDLFHPQGMVLLGFVIMMVHGHAFLTAYKIGMHSRITLTAAIYQKVKTTSTVYTYQEILEWFN